jgi:hypothetical protein
MLNIYRYRGLIVIPVALMLIRQIQRARDS